MYQIVFKNGEPIREITDEQASEMLKGFSQGADKYLFKGELKSWSNISDIKPVKEQFKQLEPPKPIKHSKDKHIKHLKDLKNGFLKGMVDKNNLKPCQKRTVENMDKAIKVIEQSSEQEFTFNHKMFGYNN